MRLLGGLFSKREIPVGERGALYPQVLEVMRDVQAYARSHGGEIHLIGVDDAGVVTVQLTGACRGCPMSGITLKLGVEDQLRLLVPGVTKVVQLK